MFKIRFFYLFVAFFSVAMLSSFTMADAWQTKSRVRKIVIDPGHGGHDSGALGKYSSEKQIALEISLKLEELLKEQLPDVELFITRKTDVYHSPIVKANLANQAKGDLFVCIHCNSAEGTKHREQIGTKTITVGKGKKKRKKTVPEYRYYTTPSAAKGTETYIWSADKNSGKEVAMKENQSLYLDSATAKAVRGFDTPEQAALINLKTRQYFERSANLALTIEEEFSKAGRVSRDAKQRGVGIWVLQAVAMPAVLVETGYISNAEEEDFLNSKDGQNIIAQAIVNAIKRYKNALDAKIK
jgi:N-acetylmuramoyl-L-alanine amidase